MTSDQIAPLPEFDTASIAVIGLGYVGLPLAVEFGRVRPVVGFDINRDRIAALRNGRDDTLETTADELAAATELVFSDDIAELAQARVYVVTVPTPIDAHKRPDLTPLVKASETVGRVLKRGDIVIYESTVYPGCTEEDCVPILERVSGLVFNRDFFAGYSPERINPGDKEHRLPTIRKVTSGSTPDVAEWVDRLYAQIITAGTFRAESIKVLMNELSIIFGRLGIDTHSVLEAAGTKWNFLKFTPGLVGGHCIGVDPYYLTHKAQAVGYHPEVILAGRRVNDGMGGYIVSQVVRLMIKRGLPVQGARVLVLGLAFKENCPDIRNTRVVDVVSEFQEYGVKVDVHDPWVDAAEAQREYGIALADPAVGDYDAVSLAVSHRQFLDAGAEALRKLGNASSVLIDVKGTLGFGESDLRI